MKIYQKNIALVLFCFLIFSSCKKDVEVRGVYVCFSRDTGKAATEMVKKQLDQTDRQCTFKSLNFISNNTVNILKHEVNGQKVEFPYTYNRNGDVIKIPQGGSFDMIFNVRNSNEVIGEGFAHGVYKKE